MLVCFCNRVSPISPTQSCCYWIPSHRVLELEQQRLQQERQEIEQEKQRIADAIHKEQQRCGAGGEGCWTLRASVLCASAVPH